MNKNVVGAPMKDLIEEMNELVYGYIKGMVATFARERGEIRKSWTTD
jgi:hypothetical protein